MTKYPSLAGHHSECPVPFGPCECWQLWPRDEEIATEEEAMESYRMYYDNDWEA